MLIGRSAWGSDGRTLGRQSGGLEKLVGEDRREKIRRQPVRAARFWRCAVGDTADGNPGSDAHCGPCGRVSRALTAIGSGGERTRNFRRLSRENRGWNSGRSRTEAEEEVRTRGHSEPIFFGFRPPGTWKLPPALILSLFFHSISSGYEGGNLCPSAREWAQFSRLLLTSYRAFVLSYGASSCSRGLKAVRVGAFRGCGNSDGGVVRGMLVALKNTSAAQP
jgi:hypothetical protein